MNNANVFNQILVLFLIMGVGYYARKREIITDEVNKGLTQFLLRITLPFLILVSFNQTFSKDILSNIIKVFLFSNLIFLVLIFISRVFFIKFSEEKKNIMMFATIFSNCGFMGFPIIESIFGKIGVLYASIFNVSFNLFIWTIGIMLFSKQKKFNNIKKILVNPGIIAVVVGIILMILPVELPLPIKNTLELVGNMTTPISMIIIGCMLSKSKISEIFMDFSLYYVSVIKLIIVPFLTYIILKLFNLDNLLLNIILICEAMPAAALCGIFAENYDNNPNYAAQSVFITTMLSIFTIPLLLTFLN